MEKDKVQEIKKLAVKIRRMSLKMALNAGKKGSHIGGSLSCVEIFAVLYGGIMKYRVEEPLWEQRDRFIASKAHCILSNFATLSAVGFFEESKLSSFLENEGMLCGHPYNKKIGLEFSGGSLGMGISAGIGMAIVSKETKDKHNIFVLLGDGECNEGSVWEGFMTANRYKLDNLTVIIDYNNMQFDGKNEDVMPLSPLSDKLEAFGFNVKEVDGHSVEELIEAFEADHEGKPKAIIAHTVKAKGLSRLENRAESHHASIEQDDFDMALKELGD